MPLAELGVGCGDHPVLGEQDVESLMEEVSVAKRHPMSGWGMQNGEPRGIPVGGADFSRRGKCDVKPHTFGAGFQLAMMMYEARPTIRGTRLLHTSGVFVSIDST